MAPIDRNLDERKPISQDSVLHMVPVMQPGVKLRCLLVLYWFVKIGAATRFKSFLQLRVLHVC